MSSTAASCPFFTMRSHGSRLTVNTSGRSRAAAAALSFTSRSPSFEGSIVSLRSIPSFSRIILKAIQSFGGSPASLTVPPYHIVIGISPSLFTGFAGAFFDFADSMHGAKNANAAHTAAHIVLFFIIPPLFFRNIFYCSMENYCLQILDERHFYIKKMLLLTVLKKQYILFSMADISPIAVLQEWLDSYLNFEKLPQKNIFWLDTMQFLCQRFNHPESCAPSFHVAGSKGKGSISVMIASILEEAGCTTGLYTSPHILNFAERIGTAHGLFPDNIYESAVKQLMNSVDSIIPEELPGQRPVTWFELVTVFAFLCFKEAHVQQAVYEVGLGGRLDATNVITPKVCCIGPIELEHTEYLGDTVEKIAAEKGGIIKDGIPVIISPQKESVRAVFKSIADKQKAPLLFTDDILSGIKTA